MNVEKIVIGSDHAGYELKLKVIDHLEERGILVVDVGSDSVDRCDYPVYADALCKKIQLGECELGILVCGTGIGMSIAANKIRGIRAACCNEIFTAEITRRHNNTNVLCMGARVIGEEVAYKVVDAFLEAEFEGGKHQRRVDMFMEFEK